jgi:hypothetical protein
MRAGTFRSQENGAAFHFTLKSFYTIFRFPINQSFPYEPAFRPGTKVEAASSRLINCKAAGMPLLLLGLLPAV